MAGTDFAAGLPDLDKYDSTQDKLEAIKSSLYMLLEELQYTLRHLDASNMNNAAMEKWLAGTIEATEIISKSVVTDELYSDYGEIADLTASGLRTDYSRAARWLDDDLSDLDYIDIRDEKISFMTGSVKYNDSTPPRPITIQLEADDGSLFYWRDSSQTRMTSRKRTQWPVWVYDYAEMVKGSLRFETRVETVNGVTRTIKMPVIELGAGSDSQHPTYGKARIVKDTDGLYITYVTGEGTSMSVTMKDDGGLKGAVGSTTLTVDTNGAYYNGNEISTLTQSDVEDIVRGMLPAE